MIFLTPCLHVYPSLDESIGQLRDIRGSQSSGCLLNQQHLKERKVIHTIGK